MAEGVSSTENPFNISLDDTSTAPDWSSKILCRYYLHGVCNRGNGCNYSHDLATGRQSNVCTYYQKGSCTYGSKCRYDHIKPRHKDYQARNQNTVSSSSASSTTATKSPPVFSPLSYPQSLSHQNANTALPNTPVPSNWSTPKPINLPRESEQQGNLVILKKGGNDSGYVGDNTPQKKSIDEWVQAAEFVPGCTWQGSAPTSYRNAAQSGLSEVSIKETPPPPASTSKSTTSSSDPELCPYSAQGECPYGEECVYFHGNVCDICGQAVLLPNNEEQNESHKKECLKVLEQDMEESFAFQRSKDKVCGICMETVMEKKPSSQQRFGILSNCNHVFCLSCIRTWRQAKSFENKIVRSCPECRVKSDFVTPSQYWVDNHDEKQKLIDGYKHALSNKPCKYFDQGRGECPFNAHCFYLHAYPDGRIASPKPRRRRRREDSDGNMVLLEPLFLWEFLEERNNSGLRTLEEDLEEIFIQLSLIHALDSDDDTDFAFSEDEDEDVESFLDL